MWGSGCSGKIMRDQKARARFASQSEPVARGQAAGREQLMRRVLRRSMPFFGAILIGAMAAGLVAGVAMLVSQS
jgi:hypothetical protein